MMSIQISVFRNKDDLVQLCTVQIGTECEHMEGLDDERFTEAVREGGREVVRALINEAHWRPDGVPTSECPVYPFPIRD